MTPDEGAGAGAEGTGDGAGAEGAENKDLIGGEAAPKKEGEEAGAEGETKTEGEEKKEAAPEPVTFESLKIPEGLEVDPELGKTFTDLINDQNLSRAELAQKLIDLQASTFQKASERASTAWEEVKEQWRSAFRTDPEVGGEKFATSLATANAIVDRFSVNPDGKPNGLKEMLTLTGVGNHVEFARLLNRIAPFLKEPTDFPGGSGTGGKVVPTRDNLYPEQG